MALTSTSIFDIVDPNKPFVLETNANGEAMGVVLMQGGCLVAFESKKLDCMYQNYLTYEQELLAIIHALKKWCHYLYGATFEVYTDHEILKWLSSGYLKKTSEKSDTPLFRFLTVKTHTNTHMHMKKKAFFWEKSYFRA